MVLSGVKITNVECGQRRTEIVTNVKGKNVDNVEMMTVY